MDRRVAITGATGFIGSHVAQRFRDGGWRVLGLVRPGSQGQLPDGVERVVVPLSEPAIVKACHGADALIHLAAAIKAPSADAYTRANVDATREVARAARTLGIRLVHTSSLAVAGAGDPRNPPDESVAPHPINAYGESKRQSEVVVRETRGLDWTILRPTVVYGPRDRQFLPIFKLARRGLFPIVNRTAAYNVVFVGDVARLYEIATTAADASGQTYFAGQQGNVTTAELLSHVATVVGRTFRPLLVPHVLLKAGAAVGQTASRFGWNLPLDRARLKDMLASGYVCRVDKARDQLGFAAEISLEEGLQSTAAWYRGEGWL